MSQRMKVTCFSVYYHLPLVERLDEAWKSMQHKNRSKAIHDAVRSFIAEFE